MDVPLPLPKTNPGPGRGYRQEVLGTYTMASVSWASRGDVQPRISPGDSGLHWGTDTLYWERSSCAAACGSCGVRPWHRVRLRPVALGAGGDPWGHPSPGSASSMGHQWQWLCRCAPARWEWEGANLLGAALSQRVTALHSRDAQQGSANTNISIKRQGKMLNASIAPCLDRHGSRGSFISSRPAQPAVPGQTDRPAGASPATAGTASKCQVLHHLP